MSATLPDPCANCGAALSGPYCATCGQHVRRVDVTLGEFLKETTHELVDWDGRVPRTLQTLVVRPGLLTADFLAGRRARWLSPLRVYLACSVAFFLSKPIVEAATGRPLRQIASISLADGGTATLTPEQRQQFADQPLARVIGIDRLERAAANPEQLNEALNTALPKAMFLLLPVFALLTSVAWRRKVPRYVPHLFTALHLHAAWFLALTMLTIVAGLVTWPPASSLITAGILAYMIWYAFATLHRVFGETWTRTLLRGLAVAVIYFGCSAVVVLFLLAITVARM